MNFVTTLLVASVSFWIGFSMRGIIELLIDIRERLAIRYAPEEKFEIEEIEEQPEPKLRFAEPKTTAELEAMDQKERIKRMNPDVKM